MIISYSKRFIFVKTRKTAGSSIQNYLATFCDPERDIVTGMSEFDGFNWKGTALERKDGTAWGHAPLETINLVDYKTDFSGFFKFTFERNPWDKVVSNWAFHNHRNDVTKEFGEFLQFPINIPVDWAKYTMGNKLAVHKVGRYESLLDDLDEICRRIRIDFDKSEFSKYNHKSGIRDKNVSYKEHYEDEIYRALVASYFRHEIAEFGYTFGG